MTGKHQRIGVAVDATDHFVQPIEAALRDRYLVSRFAPRFIKAPVVGASANKLLFELQFRRFLASHDLVFFEWAGSLLVRATQLSKRCRIVTRLHSMEVASAAHRVDWSQVDAVIVASEQMKRRLLKVANAPPNSIHVISYGVDLARFQPAPRQFEYRIGMLARVVPVKRVYEAVLTVHELRQQGYPFTLRIAGVLGDELEPRYPWAVGELIERLELAEYVHMLGRISDSAAFYRDVDIFLSNSFWEGQQVALLEAMASGCYCLSHCWGGAEEVLPSEQIFVTDSDLQTKLMNFAALPDPAKSTEQALMRVVAEGQFDASCMVRRTVDLVNNVLHP